MDGLDIHFIHVRSKHEHAMPLIVTHGWPGSIIEQFKIIDPLTNPTAYGASASDAFHLVIPSLPGYRDFGQTDHDRLGPRAHRTCLGTVGSRRRLGYERVRIARWRPGCDCSTVMAKQAPPELLGIHVNLPSNDSPRDCQGAPGAILRLRLSRATNGAPTGSSRFVAKRRGYALKPGTRPQTLYGFADSPVALAGWMLEMVTEWPAGGGDHIGCARADGQRAPSGGLTRDDVLDDITLYWVTNTGISAARIYGKSHFNFYAAADVSVPAAVSAFPGENYQAPRSWTERADHNLIYYNRG